MRRPMRLPMTHTLTRRRLVATAAASLLLASFASRGAGVAAPARADWTAIKAVIDEQLAALAAGDGERAFGYASDGIREQVGDARPSWRWFDRDTPTCSP